MKKIEELGRQAILSIQPYVPGKPIEEVEREFGITGVIKMASNENPLGPSPAVIETLKNTASTVNNYPDSNCYYLKKKLSSLFNLSEDCFIFGNGADEIIKLLGEAFLDPGDEVIYAWPTFSEYIFATKLMGAKPCPVPVEKNQKHDLKKIAEQIGSNTKMIFICNPNNPTGTIISRQEMQEFLSAIPTDIIIVVDEAYYEYVTDPQCASALEFIDKSRVIVLRTFSKIYGLAGLRIGYGVASADIISLLNRVREPFNVNLMAQEAAIVALGDQDHVQQSKKLVIDGKEYLYEQFARLGLEYIPSETNFVFVDLRKDSREVFNALLKEGVIIRTGDIFDRPSYIRVSIGTKEQNKRFIKSLEKVLRNMA